MQATIPPLDIIAMSGMDLIDFAKTRGKAFHNVAGEVSMDSLLGDEDKMLDFLCACWLAWRRHDPEIGLDYVMRDVSFIDLMMAVSATQTEDDTDDLGKGDEASESPEPS